MKTRGSVVKACDEKEVFPTTNVEMKERWTNDGEDGDSYFNLMATCIFVCILRGKGVLVGG